MAHTVVKLGGSNFKTIDDYRRNATIINAYKQPVVAVVSAFYGYTDKLLAAWKASGTHRAGPLLLETENLYEQLVGAYPGFSAGYELNTFMAEMATALNSKSPRQAQAQARFMSLGERLNASFFAACLNANGIKAKVAWPCEFGLRTQGPALGAEVDFEATGDIRKHFTGHFVYVVPGFYGCSAEGHIQLLGRGGSDYSAAALAHALQAQSLDLWKDVNGFCTANPKWVPQTQTISALSYEEASELAYFGSDIIHPRTTKPLQNHATPLRLFNNATEKGGQVMTKISAHTPPSHRVIKSLAYSADFAILEISGPEVGSKPGLLAQVTQQLDQGQINIKTVITSQTHINILLAVDDLEPAYQAVGGLFPGGFPVVSQRSNISVIAAVGQGLTQQPGVAAKLLAALAEEQINVEMISLGASPVAAYFILRPEDGHRAVQHLHKKLFPAKTQKVRNTEISYSSPKN